MAVASVGGDGCATFIDHPPNHPTYDPAYPQSYSVLSEGEDERNLRGGMIVG